MRTTDLYVLVALALLAGALLGAGAVKAWDARNRNQPLDLWTDADYEWLDSHTGEL